MEIVESPLEIKDVWKDFVEKSKNVTVYQTPEWSNFIQDSYGHKLIAVKGDNAFLPMVHVRSELFGNYIVSMPFSEYGGPVMKRTSKKVVGEGMKGLSKSVSKYAKYNNIDYIEIRLGHKPKLKLPGFRKMGDYRTFIIKLGKGEKYVWKSLDKTVRNVVRKARKNGVEVKEVGSGELGDFYRLYLRTMKRLGTPPHSKKFFERMYDTLSDKKNIRITAAEYDGKKIAFIITLPFRDRIIHWTSVYDYKYRSLNANSLLIWEAIEWGANNDYKIFDMGRTRTDSGVYDFKKSWSGKEEEIYRMVKTYREADVYKLESRKFQIASKIWSYLPLPITRFAGKYIRKNIA